MNVSSHGVSVPETNPPDALRTNRASAPASLVGTCNIFGVIGLHFSLRSTQHFLLLRIDCEIRHVRLVVSSPCSMFLVRLMIHCNYIIIM